MRKRIATAVVALGLGGTAMLFAGGSAQGHGFSTDPSSRQANCADGKVAGCGAIEHEPQSVEGPKGFPEAGPQDGTIGTELLNTLTSVEQGKVAPANAWSTALTNVKNALRG